MAIFSQLLKMLCSLHWELWIKLCIFKALLGIVISGCCLGLVLLNEFREQWNGVWLEWHTHAESCWFISYSINITSKLANLNFLGSTATLYYHIRILPYYSKKKKKILGNMVAHECKKILINKKTQTINENRKGEFLLMII